MKARTVRLQPIRLIIILFILAACAPTPVELAPLNIPIPTDQPIPTPPPPTPKASLPTPAQSSDQLNLLIISDSSNWGVGRYYAQLIEQDLKVKVSLHDCWVGSLTAKQVLRTMQNGKISGFVDDTCFTKPLKDWVKEAEALVLYASPMESPPPSGAWDVPEAGNCFNGGYQGRDSDPAAFAVYKANLQKSCAPETYVAYKADLAAILDEIIKIREGKPLILRMTDFYIPVHADWKPAGVDEVCTACFENSSQAIHQVAGQYGVPVVSTLDGLNGVDGMQDPREKGYIRSDGIHPSDTGAEFVAKLLQQSGYEPWLLTSKVGTTEVVPPPKAQN